MSLAEHEQVQTSQAHHFRPKLGVAQHLHRTSCKAQLPAMLVVRLARCIDTSPTVSPLVSISTHAVYAWIC